MKRTNEIMLNIGCGYTSTPENWINIDNSFGAKLAQYPGIKKFLYKIRIIPKRLYDLPWPSNITVLDARKVLPYKNDTVKCIYTSHFLEHLSKKEGIYFLKECYRVMMKGAIIRIIVPDLQALVKNYLDKKENIEKDTIVTSAPADEFIEGLGLFNNAGECDSLLIKSVRVLQKNKNIHKWMYDYYSLNLKLRLCGFVEIIQKGYLDSRIKDIHMLDNPDRLKLDICVEACKK